jgi:hypothetical protein
MDVYMGHVVVCMRLHVFLWACLTECCRNVPTRQTKVLTPMHMTTRVQNKQIDIDSERSKGSMKLRKINCKQAEPQSASVGGGAAIRQRLQSAVGTSVIKLCLLHKIAFMKNIHR